MNDPNAVPLDRIPVSTPGIPRFGGLPELPELPGEFAPLPPYRTPTSVTTVPFPSSPPKVVVEPPKAPPKVTVELPKPIVKTSPPPTVATTAPQPRWVREAIQDLLTPNRKKGLALTVAAGLIVGAIALNAGFSGIGSPTRSSNSVVAAATPATATLDAKTAPAPTPQVPAPKPTDGMIVPAVVPTLALAVENATQAQLPTPQSLVSIPPSPITTVEVVSPTERIKLPSAPVLSVDDVARTKPNMPAFSDSVQQSEAANRLALDEFWEREKAKEQSLQPMLPISGVKLQNEPKARSQELIKRVDYAEPLVTIVTPIPTPASPITATPAQPIPTPTPTIPVFPPSTIVPAASSPVSVPDVKPVVPSVAPPMIPTSPVPTIPELVKPIEMPNPIVPKSAALLTPTGEPSAFKLEPPLTVAPTLPTPQPPAPSLSGLTFPVAAPQAPALQPISQPAIRPVTNTEVRTAIDVDLHEPKRGDTYASISKMHYGDDRYAAAIQAFNKGRNLGDGAAIELPLTQYLRQNYRQYIGGTPPVSNDPARTPEWAPSAGRIVPTPRTFTVNREGMTMWDVAEDVYGDRQKWKQIQDANPQLDANERYRIGERFRLPLDAPQTVKRVP